MKLIALRCPNCNHGLKPGNEDILLACPNCQIPVAIAVDGPKRVKVRFALPLKSEANVQEWVPFWVFEGRVKVTVRETQSGWRTKDKDSNRLWGSPRRFYVPAWDLNVHTAQEVGSRLVVSQPEFTTVNQPKQLNLVPAIVKPADARKLLEFIILAIEARRKDWLKEFAFNLEVGKPQLWALPRSGLKID
jgi:hypothetical protein